jgi:hypothetical protein
MGDTCYLCELGSANYIVTGLAAGEGFGTCRSCSVHACPRHGERPSQYFRCADCFAAEGSARALKGDFASSPAEALAGRAARLSTLAVPIRQHGDTPRMGAAVQWIRGRIHNGQPLVLADDAHSADTDARELLGLPASPELDDGQATEAAILRAARLEAELSSQVSEVAIGDVDQEEQGELAVLAVSIAYAARGAESLEQSPLEMRGGLTLPPAVAVLGHAYARANAWFW